MTARIHIKKKPKNQPSREQLLDLLEEVLPIIKPDASLRWYKNDRIRDDIRRVLKQERGYKDGQ